MSEKLTARHLDRRALIYVRQSSHQQLMHNLESRRLQYSMEERVRGLGWRETEVIDEDQGLSATSTAGRTGFQRLVAEVCLGKIGAVAAIEVSRFARNNRDWHQLIEMCAMVETLLIDHEAIYDPRRANDRLLLGLKGSMSEYELDLLRQRSLEARWAKARRGELVIAAPVGFVKTADQRLEKDPDIRVQKAIELVFRKFFELGTARRTGTWFVENGLELPAKRRGPSGYETWWRRPSYGTVIKLLKEPTYAGAYAYGRTSTHTEVVDGSLRRRIVRKPLDEWSVLIPDHHEGYIGWDQFQRIQQMLDDNVADFRPDRRRGAPKRGPALLAGLLRCGRCGRKLMVGYSGKNRSVPRYQCHRARLDHLASKCISFGGLLVDKAVAKEVLEVARPCAIEAAGRAVSQAAARSGERLEALSMEREAARYAAELARRRYEAIDPDNRLVAVELERRWEQALQTLRELDSRLERETAEQPQSPSLDEMADLGLDLERAWAAPETDSRIRKRILRALIEEIVVDLDEGASEVVLTIHWKGGVHGERRIPRRRRGQSGAHTSPDVVDAVRELARICNDRSIAGFLTRNGLLTARGNRWSAMAVTSLRNHRGIPVHAPAVQQAEGWMNLTAAAAYVGVAAKTLRLAAERGDVPAKHPLRDGPWVFNRQDLEEKAVRNLSRACVKGERHPAGPCDDQLTLDGSST